jgi:hypothetical protein
MIPRRFVEILDRWRAAINPPPVAHRAELKRFVTREAAFLANKSVIGYCRVKTMYDFDKLMSEPAFRTELERARWRAFTLTLGDVLVLTEQMLRPEEEDARLLMVDRLVELYGEALNEEAAESSEFVPSDERAAFDSRLRRMGMGRCAPHNVCRETARAVHEAVPIHPDLKRLDLEIIESDLKFHLVALSSVMHKRMLKSELQSELLG